VFVFFILLSVCVLLICKYTNLCSYVQVFVIIFLIFFIYFQLPLGLNKQFISLLQIFVGTWDKMEARDQALEESQKLKK
jgi:hypothetical protein